MAIAATWTSEQVLALSPDVGSTKRGKTLATPAKWSLLGQSKRAIWGECKGSGKNPYRTAVDLLNEPAFRCSCPSRKFPCKHALALFLLLAEGASFTSESQPAWVAAWLEKRSQTAQKKRQKESAKTAIDSTAQSKRAQERVNKVDAGITDLEQWLQDIIRQGLADLPSQPYRFWDRTAARLVDAQAPGLARQVQNLAGIPHTGEGWPARMLTALGQIHLLLQGYRNLPALAPQMQAEVRSQIGWTQTQADLLARASQSDPLVDSVEDSWQVLGKAVTKEASLKVQRVWLWGMRSEQAVLVLSFAHGRSRLDASLVPGACFNGEVVLYPGTGIRRAFVKSRVPAKNLDRSSLGTDTIEEAIAQYAKALCDNPWTRQFPLLFNRVWMKQDKGEWWLHDEAGLALPVAHSFKEGWEMVAMSGGRPLGMFGEWNGETFLPLSLWRKQSFLPLGA